MGRIHPLGQLMIDAASRHPPPADGGWQRVPPWSQRVQGIVAFTGHAVFAVEDDIDDTHLAHLGVDGFGGAHDPRVVAALAGRDGWIDSLDLVLARQGTAARSALIERTDLVEHSRARLARTIRDDVSVFGLPDPARTAVVTIGTGIGGLREMSFELEPEQRGVGGAAALVAAAVGLMPEGETVLAAVAPGNVASVRVLLAAGFCPVASVQLFRRHPARAVG